MKYVGIIIFFVLSSSSSIFATNIEIYNGYYSYANKNLHITFEINNGDVNYVQINGLQYRKNIDCEFLGEYGSTGFFQIEFSDKHKYDYSIQLLILHSDASIFLVSGFYVVYDTNKSVKELNIVNKKTIEMQFKTSK